MISEILRKELDRFEKTKGKEMSKSLKDYAKENMDTTVQVPFAFAFAFAFVIACLVVVSPSFFVLALRP
jgi:hypothetical protein